MKYQGLRELRKITAWKDGCVWKTAPAGYAWVDIDYKGEHAPDNILICTPSTSISRELSVNKTMRKADDSVAQIVPVTLAELGYGSRPKS